ncbi:hypothetical protein VM1G_03646 [Cytospora mali]|uniref:C2H2-type domain-containing protein n=1 Tax=Cytospora mali TaxID=578113 RepID=A0A194VW77_CYTMA|nr:hypothetical protein VM1G_03646 [Valsa mali]
MDMNNNNNNNNNNHNINNTNMDDSAMMRYLLGKYGLTDLVGMMRSMAANEQGAIMPPATSSSNSHIAMAFEANPSPISFSDASSITGSLYSTCSDTSSFHSLSLAPSPASNHNVMPGHNGAQTSSVRSIGRKVVRRAAGASKRSNLGGIGSAWGNKKTEPFECPFCGERGITVEIKRKNDLKRHFHEFHTNHSVWTCATAGCGLPFEWKSAYTNHLKSCHQGVGPLPDDAMAKTCPQVVFACGFVDCKRIFEAQSDEDADKKAHEYFAHVADHFDGDGLTHRDWSYSARFRNLMRQSPVDEAWKRRVKLSSESPTWQALSSFTLRKMLECRHIPDVQQFVQCASALGYAKKGTPTALPPGFFIPIRGSCQMASVNHRTDRSQTAIDQQMQQQHQQHTVDIPDFSPFETPLPTFPKVEEDATSMSKISMVPAQMNFTPHSLPPDATAWTTPHDPQSAITAPQDLSNTSFLFLDPDDSIITTPNVAHMPLPTAPTNSFGYWTDLLAHQNGYGSMSSSMLGPDDHQQHHQQIHQQVHPMHQQHYTTSRAPDPPIGSNMQQGQQQQQGSAAAQKRRWSMRTSSSGRTVVPLRDSAQGVPYRDSTITNNTDSRPGSIMSSVFHFGGS